MTDKNTTFQREVSHFSLKHLILYIAHNIIHENIKQGKELEQEESKGLSQMSEEEENELMLPDLPKKILEKLKKYKGAIILNEMPLEIQFPSDKFLDLLLEDWLVEGPEVNFTPNQSLSLQCRAELLNIFHSFHSHRENSQFQINYNPKPLQNQPSTLFFTRVFQICCQRFENVR